jgi:hypothetical protein
MVPSLILHGYRKWLRGNVLRSVFAAAQSYRPGSPTSQVTGVPACQPRSDDAELRLVAVDRHDAVLLLDLIVSIQYALPLEAGYRLELLLCERPIGVFANAGRLRRLNNRT